MAISFVAVRIEVGARAPGPRSPTCSVNTDRRHDLILDFGPMPARARGGGTVKSADRASVLSWSATRPLSATRCGSLVSGWHLRTRTASDCALREHGGGRTLDQRPITCD